MKPLIGITCCNKAFGLFGTHNHAASDTYVRAVDRVVAGMPVLIPANGRAADPKSLVERLDGIVLTGSRSNVHPSLYEGPAHADYTPEDEDRDRVTLPLIREAIAAGVPVLAICRGLQEMNVALGGSLHQWLPDLPGRLDHSTPMHPDHAVRTGKAHAVEVTPGTLLHRLAGARRIAVNSLHNQGIERLAPGLSVEGTAPDGTIEAVRVVRPGVGFAYGVQWHPEYDFETDTVSWAIFAAFGDAVRARGERYLAAAD